MNRVNKCLAIAIGVVGMGAVSAHAQPISVMKSAYQPTSSITRVAVSPERIIELKILQTILRRQLVQTVKVAYCQSASPSVPRCR